VAEQQENVGFSAHELNNNNANIFRLKRRVKELERKIGMMQLRNEETKEMNGVRIIHNYGADRIQLFFTEKPVSARLRQLKGNGWHWSPSAGCWQRKITESARKSATCIYKGEISEEYMNMPAPVAGISKEVKKKVKIKKESVSKKEVKSVAESVVESLPVAESVAAVESVIAPKSKVIVESKAATIKVAVVSSVAGSIKKTEDPIAKKKEEVIEKEEKINSKASKREITKKEKVAAKRELKREIIIKPKTELKAEKKPEEKPKAIDWAKIASQVERSGEPEVIIEPKQTSKPENETSAGGYSYEAYID
jgi:hypothetical protein